MMQKILLLQAKIQIMVLSNFHTHTKHSDGKAEAEIYCEKALQLGFHSLGFSDHAPVPFQNNYSIINDRLDDYFSEINLLKEKYKEQLNVFLSLEADYIPNHSYSFNFFREKVHIDYIIGSIHMVYHKSKDRMWFIDGGDQNVWDRGLKEVFDQDIKQAVRAFYQQTQEMISTQKPEVIGHLDKIKMHNKERLFHQNERWYQNLVSETLELIKQNGSILEINTRGLYKGRCKDLFPSAAIALEAQKMGIPLMLSSDAHHPDELNGAFDLATKELREIGIQNLFKFTKKGWQSYNY